MTVLATGHPCSDVCLLCVLCLLLELSAIFLDLLVSSLCLSLPVSACLCLSALVSSLCLSLPVCIGQFSLPVCFAASGTVVPLSPACVYVCCVWCPPLSLPVIVLCVAPVIVYVHRSVTQMNLVLSVYSSVCPHTMHCFIITGNTWSGCLLVSTYWSVYSLEGLSSVMPDCSAIICCLYTD